MPNIPKMGLLWYALDFAIMNAVTGKQSATIALKEAEAKMRSSYGDN